MAADIARVRLDYRPRRQFVASHRRSQRFACIVTHRRAGKTVACIHDLHRGATRSQKLRPRYAYLAPFLRQSKAVAWDYLRAAIEPARAAGARANESELRIDYADHIVPHDAQAKELGTGKSRLEVLANLGLKHITLAPLRRIEDGINAVRMFLPRCWFDAGKCARGLDALKLYRADYDDKLQALRPHPVHDWTSHAADSFRYLAMTLDGRQVRGFYRRIEYGREGVV